MNKRLQALGLAALVGISAGCNDNDNDQSRIKYDEGTISRITGNMPELVKSSGALFGNESVKIGEQYVIVVDTADGKYTMQIKDFGTQSLPALATALEVGDKIRFPLTWGSRINGYWSNFSSNKIGTVYSDEIEILQKVNTK